MLGIECDLAALVVEHIVQITLDLFLHGLGIKIADVVSSPSIFVALRE